MSWERARSEEQVEYRVNEILEATAKLYEENRFEEITFVMIAKQAGFTRSNLYRYFKTKEDIFLKLLSNDISVWVEEIQENFGEREMPLSDFTDLWVSTLLKHERMLEIYTILNTLLEKHATLDALVDFKRSLMANIDLSLGVLVKVLPTDHHRATEFLNASIALATGMYPMMKLTSKQQKAAQAVGMEVSAEMATSMLESTTLSVLKGMLH